MDAWAAALFAAGGALGFAGLTWRAWTRRRLLWTLGLAPVLWGFTVLRTGEVMPGTFLALLIGLGTLALVFRETILPHAGEGTLVAFLLPVWAFLAEAAPRPVAWAAMGGLAVPTLLTVALVLTRRPLPRWARTCAYTWFLVLLVAVGAFSFAFGSLGFFFPSEHRPPPAAPGGLEAFLLGTVFAYLGAHATYLYWLVRLPGRGESAKEYKATWRKHARLLGDRFTDGQLRPLTALAALAVFTGLYLGGRTVGLPYHVVVAPWILTAPMVLQGLLDRPVIGPEAPATAS